MLCCHEFDHEETGAQGLGSIPRFYSDIVLGYIFMAVHRQTIRELVVKKTASRPLSWNVTGRDRKMQSIPNQC
jgi:hypothetical protein